MTAKRILPFILITAISLSVISCKPACPIGPCQVRMVHPHGEGEYRGVPIWKKQNLKYGEKAPVNKEQRKIKTNDKSKNKN